MVASENANAVKEEANIVKERAVNLVDIITADQKEAEGKLSAAKPALDAAEAALLVCYLEILITYIILHNWLRNFTIFFIDNQSK